MKLSAPKLPLLLVLLVLVSACQSVPRIVSITVEKSALEEELIDYDAEVLALDMRAKEALNAGNLLRSVKFRIQMDGYLRTDEAIDSNHALIWETLNRISESALSGSLSELQTIVWKGWLELNLIARRSGMLPALIEPEINQWYQQYGDHPASIRFAFNLLEESKRIDIKPGRIALMLPFSGRHQQVSEAIQNGFLYAYYQNNEDDAPILEIVNVSDDPEAFNLQYEQAIQDGADFVVGPISKKIVNHLQQQQQLKVPTLALNYDDRDMKQITFNLYQFGLSPEDEASQIADFAFAEEKRSAAILVPDTKWGARLQIAFTERFESLGGDVIGTGTYPPKKNDYSNAIKKLLNLSSSNQRHIIIQHLLGEPVQFEPRRRQDIDMIFIAGNARQARLLKPQLKFHHAQGVPVYATSHITTGNSDVDKDRDLDKVRFVDMPWILNRHANPDYGQIRKLWPDDNFNRLFALGIDAYRLIPSLRRLMLQPETSANHHTGELSVDRYGRIHRRLLMAIYEKGLAKVIQPANSVLHEPE